MNTNPKTRRHTRVACALAAPLAVAMAFLGAGTASAESQQDTIARTQRAYNDAVSKRDAAAQQVGKDEANKSDLEARIFNSEWGLGYWEIRADKFRQMADDLAEAARNGLAVKKCGVSVFTVACVENENRLIQQDIQNDRDIASAAQQIYDDGEQKLEPLRFELAAVQGREQADQRQLDAANAAVAAAKSQLDCVKEFGCWQRQSGTGRAPSLAHQVSR